MKPLEKIFQKTMSSFANSDLIQANLSKIREACELNHFISTIEVYLPFDSRWQFFIFMFLLEYEGLGHVRKISSVLNRTVVNNLPGRTYKFLVKLNKATNDRRSRKSKTD